MFYTIFLIVLSITLLFVFYKIVLGKNLRRNWNGKIEGKIFGKYTKREEQNIKVALGKIETDGKNQNFIKTDEKFTDLQGRYCFDKLELKSYWIMAEKNGKKVLKYVKLTEEKKEIEDVILII